MNAPPKRILLIEDNADLAYGLRTGLSGRPPVDLTSPLDYLTFAGFGLFFVWAIWLAIRLWQGR